MIEIAEFEMAYSAVPKAGCTSVKTAIAELLGERPAEDDEYAVHPKLPTRRFAPRRFHRYDGWHRFTVVRDPIKRLLSVYTDLVATRNILRNSANIRRGRVDLPVKPDPDFFFQNLDAYRSAASVIKHHALRQILFTGPDLTLYDQVYDVSQLGRLGEDLSLMTGRPVSFDKPMNASKFRLKLDDLVPASRDVIHANAADDYAAFGGYLAEAA
ncbi:sulfotransferase family 2 domain-containing protein [Maritimibacter sp. UBA3975]|uniref:sulfotransferase family 2 domain-containing protein n=1 Tax=Maritimibacter sp. UBA3975 TaxID=1946833 RepID=UPI000C092212|nr:sulfotransferase family 2 domain-containing protein [Maritimibacter sp. UBA3975]MAM63918.1 hypothetical protein [Maritimibacter sp.]|tara:strand:+ start:21933 stop:22571 length:639 start_codon:yes stop_codon:yes gene_type:complete